MKEATKMKRIHQSILLAVLITSIFWIHCGDKNPAAPPSPKLTQVAVKSEVGLSRDELWITPNSFNAKVGLRSI